MTLQSSAYWLASGMAGSRHSPAVTVTLFLFFLYLGFSFFLFFLSWLQPQTVSIWWQDGFRDPQCWISSYLITVGTREAVCPMSHLNWASWAQVGLVSIPGSGIVARGMRNTGWCDRWVLWSPEWSPGALGRRVSVMRSRPMSVPCPVRAQLCSHFASVVEMGGLTKRLGVIESRQNF